QDAELVAAEPPDDVGIAHAVDEDLGDMLEGGIAGSMAVLVVDGLQPVEVEIDDAGRRAVAPGKGHHARQLAHEGTSVRDWHQRILVGEALEKGDAAPRLVELAAQPIDLAEKAQ